MQEIIEKRIRASKTHSLGNNRFALDAVIGALHYKDNYADESESWKDIDTTIQPDGTVRSAPYELDITFNPIAIRVKSKEDGSEFRLELSNASQARRPVLPVVSEPVILGNLCIFKDVFPDTDIVIEAAPTRVGFYRELKSAVAPTEWHFDVEEIGKHKVSAIVCRANDASDKPDAPLVEVERLPGKLIERVHVVDRVFPIQVNASVEVQTDSSGDDGDSRVDTSNFTTDGAKARAGSHSSQGVYYAYAYFGSVTIPSGATIDTSTVVKVYRYNTDGTPLIKLYCEDTGSPVAPTSYAEHATDRGNGTTAKIDWDGAISAGWNDSPEFQSVIAELQASYDYSSGAPILVLFDDDGGASGNINEYRAYDYTGNTYGPRLHIEYTEAGGQNYDRLAAVAIGVTTASSRVMAYDRDSAVVLGITTVASRIKGAVRSASVPIGLTTAASVAMAYTRSASVALGLTSTASRATTYTRNAATAIGITTAASVVKGFTRAASVAIGITTAASRAWGVLRSASVAIGITTSASRATTITRSAATAIGVLTSASRIIAVARSASVAIGISTSASRVKGIVRSASTALGLTTSASRVFGFSRTAVVQLGITTVASRAATYTRSASVAIGMTTSASYAIDALIWIWIRAKALYNIVVKGTPQYTIVVRAKAQYSIVVKGTPQYAIIVRGKPQYEIKIGATPWE